MPKPPKESIGQRIVANTHNTIKNPSKCLDFFMASTIFLAAVLELLSWHFAKGKTAVITDVGNNYLIYYYPLLNTVIIWVFSLFFLLKILRYKSCIYTQLVTIIYFLVQSINLGAFLFGYGTGTYESIGYPLLLVGIVLITLTKVVRWFLK